MPVVERIALGLEYHGGSFKGWQSQAGGGTVQDALEQALAEIAGDKVRVAAAGRTDAGVHALVQVVHFDVMRPRPLQAWVRGTNTYLPATIAVRWAASVPQSFHARFSATAREYRYMLWNHPVRPAVAAGQVGWTHAALDLSVMQTALAAVLGRQDFSALRSSECQAKSPVRTVYEATVQQSGHWFQFHIRADGFLHHMVRNLVGALIQIGRGRHDPSWLASLLASRDRRLGAPTFAPDGLYLSGVQYDQCWNLPAEDLIRQIPCWPRWAVVDGH
ncbi:MAG TPA: tRNA pseudouridine(38-40) synthase TruA [Rhodocyclaceae bacterium]|nr:tRNA pseudouridine(38-40) synthase TruA [Rhodocyclaceae bacterium]